VIIRILYLCKCGWYSKYYVCTVKRRVVKAFFNAATSLLSEENKWEICRGRFICPPLGKGDA
jgi:hypothetical protein